MSASPPVLLSASKGAFSRHFSGDFQLRLSIMVRVSSEDLEELAYLQEALAVLKHSLQQEENPGMQAHLREYIADIERRIAAAQQKR